MAARKKTTKKTARKKHAVRVQHRPALEPKQVRSLRTRYEKGTTVAALSKELGVSAMTVYRALHAQGPYAEA